MDFPSSDLPTIRTEQRSPAGGNAPVVRPRQSGNYLRLIAKVGYSGEYSDMTGALILHARRLLASVCLLALLLFCAACSGGNTSTATPTPKNTGGSAQTAIPSPSPGVKLGPQPCPALVQEPAHWDPIIPTQVNVSKVEKVVCGYLSGKPTLQALVTVRYQGTGALLDVYVYDNIESPNPTQLFKLQSLYKGDAKISLYNTVITAEVDQASSINRGKSNAAQMPDLFREFNTGSFAPVSFPAFFPDLTRYQAEQDQARVNQGQDGWKLDPAGVATHFVTDPHVLNWSSNVTTTVVSGGGKGDGSAVVSVKNNDAGGGTIQLTMQRLEGNTNGGIWEIVTVTANGLSIDTPKSRDILSSPVTVSGTGNAFEGKIGRIIVLDHTLSDIGHASATGAAGNGATSFSTSVSYTSTFKTGLQDGIIALYATNNAGGSLYSSVVMVKELLH